MKRTRNPTPTILAVLGIASLYALRAVSCGLALSLEVHAPDDHYGHVDPHGFGVLGAMYATVLCAPLILPLLVRRRTTDAPIGTRTLVTRSVAAGVAIGMPSLVQISYLISPITPLMAMPIVIASLSWFATVLAISLNTGTTLPSLHAAFDRSPRLAWAAIAILIAAKAGFATYAGISA